MFENIALKPSDILIESSPVFALVGYESNDYNNKNNALKLFPIKNGNIQAESPISFETLKGVFKIFKDIEVNKNKELSFKGLIPKNIVYFKNNEFQKKIIWTNKPNKKYLQFSDSSSIESGYYYLPKLLFSLSKNELKVFAVKDAEIRENTILYNSPFLNIFKNGGVCMGSASINISPFSYIEDVIIYVENMFYNSIFTHTNHDVIINGNLSLHYKKTKDTNIKFDDKLLLESSTSLTELF